MIGYVQLAATVALALVAAWIALLQVDAARAKLQMDLYEKRFAVFDATRKLIVKCISDERVDINTLSEFHLSTIEGEFLFGPEIPGLVAELRTMAANLSASYNEMANTGDQAAINRHAKLSQEFLREHDQLAEAFRPYLRIDRQRLLPVTLGSLWPLSA